MAVEVARDSVRLRGPRLPGLIAVGALMIASLFIYANPWFGAKSTKWPWQYFAEALWLSRKADLLLWVVVGGLAIWVGPGRGGRFRFVWLLSALSLLVARC